MNKFTKIAFVFGLLFFGSFSFAEGNVTDDNKVVNGSNEDANAITQKELTLAKADTSTDDWDDAGKEPDFDGEEELEKKKAEVDKGVAEVDKGVAEVDAKKKKLANIIFVKD